MAYPPDDDDDDDGRPCAHKCPPLVRPCFRLPGRDADVKNRQPPPTIDAIQTARRRGGDKRVAETRTRRLR